jgi:predicted RNA-binding protein YlxR (DUF448 family)
MKKIKVSTKGKRTCVGCRKRVDKKDVVTFKNNNGVLVLDEKGDLSGKGMNICRNIDCYDLAVEKGSFKRVQKVKEISDDIRKQFLLFIES